MALTQRGDGVGLLGSGERLGRATAPDDPFPDNLQYIEEPNE